ncbi:folate family ECF transporter S component [Fructilactobacillus sp. Tb1]|uniref:folate family ECF transporter S component n=1 Tax=Fructilactobacillus sp. Tb1 TaxID=3422304 RepID=UPI003D26F5AD
MESFKKWGLRPLSVKGISYLAVLMAIEIVLSRLVIGNANVSFTFTFVAVALIARWYGPFWSVGIAFIVDFIQNLMSGQPYFFGFTVSAMLGALVYSFAFYNRKKISLLSIVLVVLFITIFINILMNTLWVSILAHTNFFAFLPIRIVKNCISLPIQIGVLYWILNNKNINHMRPEVFK